MGKAALNGRNEDVANKHWPKFTVTVSGAVPGKLELLHELEKTSLEEKKRRLFEAWDLDGDGFVDFSEMAMGLHKIQPEAMLGGAADAAMGSILQFDTDDNQRCVPGPASPCASATCCCQALTCLQQHGCKGKGSPPAILPETPFRTPEKEFA